MDIHRRGGEVVFGWLCLSPDPAAWGDPGVDCTLVSWATLPAAAGHHGDGGRLSPFRTGHRAILHVVYPADGALLGRDRTEYHRGFHGGGVPVGHDLDDFGFWVFADICGGVGRSMGDFVFRRGSGRFAGVRCHYGGGFFTASPGNWRGTGLPQALPPRHLDFGLESSGALVWMWIGWNVLFGVLSQMDLRNSGKFVRVKDDASARKMVLVMLLPSFVILLPLLMQIPSMCAAVLYPDLSTVFPNLKRPEEGAWLAMALTVLPQGLIGLMVCTMFGAAADSTDAALNSNAGFFTRNVYKRYIRPDASEKNQVLVGKLVTLTFGIITIGVGLAVNSLRTLNLFDLFQVLNAMLLPPMIVPMVLGIFYKHTPDWSGWSTVLAGFLAAVLTQSLYSAELVQSLLGLDRALTPREIVDSQFLFISSGTWGVSIAWFFATSFFWKKSAPEKRERINLLFDDLARPVNHLGEGGENQDAMQYRIVSVLALIVGGFLALGVLIPNPLSGRVTFLLIGGLLILMGIVFFRLSQRRAATPSQ